MMLFAKQRVRGTGVLIRRLVSDASRASTPKPPQAQVFIDLNWVDTQLSQIAAKRFGDDFMSSCVYDASPLKEFLQSRVAEVLSIPAIDITAAYGYGSLRKDSLASLRALAEEGVAIRNFFAGRPDNLTAPAVSFAADIVHACAIRGGNVDTGYPLSSKLAPANLKSSPLAEMQPTQIIVALIGSPVYFPALVRAMQHNRTVVVGSSRADWTRLLQAMLPEQREATPPVLLDDMLSSMVIPLTQFRARGLPKEEIARRLHASLLNLNRQRAEDLIPSSLVANTLLQMGMLKELRRTGLFLASFLSTFPELFETTHASGVGGGYAVKLRANPAVARLPSIESKASDSQEQLQGVPATLQHNAESLVKATRGVPSERVEPSPKITASAEMSSVGPAVDAPGLSSNAAELASPSSERSDIVRPVPDSSCPVGPVVQDAPLAAPSSPSLQSIVERAEGLTRVDNVPSTVSAAVDSQPAATVSTAATSLYSAGLAMASTVGSAPSKPKRSRKASAQVPLADAAAPTPPASLSSAAKPVTSKRPRKQPTAVDTKIVSQQSEGSIAHVVSKSAEVQSARDFNDAGQPIPSIERSIERADASAATIPAPEGHSTPISESTELRVPIDSAVELTSAKQIVGPPENDTLIYAGKPSPPLIGEQDRTKPDNGQSLSSADLGLHALRVLTIAVEAGVIESAAPTAANLHRIIDLAGLQEIAQEKLDDAQFLLGIVKAHHPTIKVKLLSIKFSKL